MGCVTPSSTLTRRFGMTAGDAFGNPVGKPVAFPYIPMMAVTEEQLSELAYGVLKYVVEHGEDADMFDASLDRIVRLDARVSPTGVAFRCRTLRVRVMVR